MVALTAIPLAPAYAMAAMGSSGGRVHAADLALMRAVVDGDGRSQRELLVRLLPHLRAVSRAMLGTSADAEDAAQTAALNVLERAASYRGEAKVERWARTVATTTCIDLLRRRSRLREVGADEGAESVEAVVDPRSRPGDALPRSVHSYLAELPEAQRQVVVLRHVLEYTVAEIAELLGLPFDTTKSRLLYGRRALRKAIRRDLQVGQLRAAGEGGPR